jgi:hypothetical protein
MGFLMAPQTAGQLVFQTANLWASLLVPELDSQKVHQTALQTVTQRECHLVFQKEWSKVLWMAALMACLSVSQWDYLTVSSMVR